MLRFRRSPSVRVIAPLLVASAAVALIASGVVYIKVRRILGAAAAQAADSSYAVSTISELQPVASAFTAAAPVAGFRSAVAFNGDLYVCGSSSLFRYRAGELKQRWTVGKELPPSPLHSLAVRTGIVAHELWVATEGSGVLMYDGARFRQILPQDPALRQITALLPLSSGSVLAGTADAGLYVSDGKSLRLLHSQFQKTRVTALAGDEDELWVGTPDEGAWFWRGGQAWHIRDELPDPDVLAITVGDGRAWIGTPLGVSEFAAGKLTRHFAEGIFARALAERDGELWIGTIDQGTIVVPLAAHTPRLQISDRPILSFSPAAFSQINARLFAVEERDIRELPSGQEIVAAPEDALADRHVSSLHADSLGRLWVGYFDRGLDLEDRPHGGSPKHFEDDVLFCVNRIKEDPEHGMTAVATANGLALFDHAGELRQILDREHGLIASHVTDVLFRQNQGSRSMMLATPAGLSSVERGDITSLSGFQGLVNNHVYTLAEVDGVVYAGTLGGVSALRNGLVEASFTSANSQLRQNWITASASADGRLYLGTYGAGVVRFEPNTGVTAYREFARQRIEINPNAMLATARAVYAGTAGQGLAVLGKGEERWRFVDAGLPSLDVTAIEERDGTLYIGTDNGLTSIREDGLPQ